MSGKDNFIREDHSLENKGSLLKELVSSTSCLCERVDRFGDNNNIDKKRCFALEIIRYSSFKRRAHISGIS